MGRISKMSLKEIFEYTDFIMKVEDIVYFCQDSETINEFIELDKRDKLDNNKIKEFLIQHEDKLDKEKLILNLVRTYIGNINIIEELLKNEFSNNNDSLRNDDIEINKKIRLERQKQVQKENLRKAKRLGKGINKIIPIYFYNKLKGRYDIKIIDSRELIDGMTIDRKTNLKRFKKIDEQFRELNKEESAGIEYVLQSIVLTDFTEIFSDIQLGDELRTLILDNLVIREKIKTRKELEEIRRKDFDEYNSLVEDSEFEKILPDIRNVVEEYIEYVDIDKLLIICSYRFEESLEDRKIENTDGIKLILKNILKQIKEKNQKYNFRIQRRKDYLYEDEYIEYSVEDIKSCIKRIVNNKYFTKEKINEIRKDINSGKIKLEDIGLEDISIIFSEKELEEKAILSDENLMYIAKKLNWNGNKILQKIKEIKSCSTEMLKHIITQEDISINDIFKLYINNIININQIKEVKDGIDLSKSVNPYGLIQYYTNSIEKGTNEESKKQYKRYLELYKVLVLEDSPEKIEDYANKLMEEMIENYNKENEKEHIDQLEEFYKNKLLTLNVILEWNDEAVVKKVITDLYKENIIDFETIKGLVKKGDLKFEYAEELVWKEDISLEERVKVLEQGWIPEEEIFKLFKNALIREEDLLKLSEKSIISRENVDEIINETSLEDLQKHSRIVLIVDHTVQKIKTDPNLQPDEDDNNDNQPPRKKKKLMIEPNKRLEYFSLLGAGVPDEVKISSDSPFYNYEFYIIPDESGKINKNSVVIAERIYEEKEENIKKDAKNKEIKFATDNATYFLKLRDLMVLSNYLKKDDVVNEEKNIIFKANHILATDKKNGYWAAGVLYGIAKTMLSSDLKEYSKENQRLIIMDKLGKMYSHEQIMKILDKAHEIDSGEHTCEIIEDEGR